MITITIVVLPAISRRGRRLHGVFDAYHRGQFICRSAAPLPASARVLLCRGEDPKSTIEMRHASNPAVVVMTAPIGVAAKWTVLENQKSGPKLVRWRAFSRSDVSAPMRSGAPPALTPIRSPEPRKTEEVLP